jgi:hypothetical protein
MQERQNVRLVLAVLSLTDIINDHVSDFLHAVLLLQKVLSKGGSGDFGQLLSSAIARIFSSVKPDRAMQSSKLIIKSNRKGRAKTAAIATS